MAGLLAIIGLSGRAGGRFSVYGDWAVAYGGLFWVCAGWASRAGCGGAMVDRVISHFKRGLAI